MNAISLEEISLPYKLWKRHLCVNKLNIKKCLWKKENIKAAFRKSIGCPIWLISWKFKEWIQAEHLIFKRTLVSLSESKPNWPNVWIIIAISFTEKDLGHPVLNCLLLKAKCIHNRATKQKHLFNAFCL